MRRGFIKPLYAELNPENIGVAKDLIEAFKGYQGRRKGDLQEELRGYEDMGWDYRFIRGLITLLERRCRFEAKSLRDPLEARRLVFQEAEQRGGIADREERGQVLASAAEALGVSVEELEGILWSDLDEELILEDFEPLDPRDLLQWYNLSLTQTLLFRSTLLEFSATDNWKRIFRRIKGLGLIYSIEKRGGSYHVTVDGPFSLFKLSKRYGTYLAKLLPVIIEAGEWWVRGSILGAGIYSKRILRFEVNSRELGDKIKAMEPPGEELYDSSVEEGFAKLFQSLGSQWRLRREPEPLIVHGSVMIPDFSFEKDGLKVYLEIVGFWTKEYLERKLEKLEGLRDVDMIIAVDRELACSRLKKARGEVIYYKREVPVKPILRYLSLVEERRIAEEERSLREKGIRLEGDLVKIPDLAKKMGVSEKALHRSLGEMDLGDYRLIGDLLISQDKLGHIRSMLEALEKPSLQEALELIRGEGGDNPYQILEALGYGVKWRGLDPGTAQIYKREGEDDHP